MKRDEPFDSSIKSKSTPEGLIFRLAHRQDCHAISKLMSERNPTQSFADMEASTNRELDRVESGANYKLYVAELNGEVIGLCRFYHSEGLPSEQKVIPES